jgi:hypothetical protein
MGRRAAQIMRSYCSDEIVKAQLGAVFDAMLDVPTPVPATAPVQAPQVEVAAP